MRSSVSSTVFLSSLLVSVSVAFLLLSSSQAAIAGEENSIAGVEEKCGYLGWAKYRHCDGGSGATVTLDVQDLWGNIREVCVWPGVTDLQPYMTYRVTGAWWNGGVWC
ncbi:DUF6355 family natural product biosynthesis protein [Saccharothrix sp. AJ9571]|nr:DUF6355 family natural product biosynthesis protein [Saccharothrix sp. AJ9571]